jgi:hypothetical protein
MMTDIERSTRSRGERYRLMMAHRAAARALESSLKDEAAEEYEREGVGVSWRLPGDGLVLTSLRKDSVTVTDEAAFLAWVDMCYPDEVRTVRFVRESWREAFFKHGLAVIANAADGEKITNPDEGAPGERFEVADANGGSLVPGVRWVKGGGLASVAVRVDKDAERRMNLAAATYAQGLGAMPGLESGERA